MSGERERAEAVVERLYAKGCRCRDGHTMYPPCMRCLADALLAFRRSELDAVLAGLVEFILDYDIPDKSEHRTPAKLSVGSYAVFMQITRLRAQLKQEPGA
jgi:hypothetical protein